MDDDAHDNADDDDDDDGDDYDGEHEAASATTAGASSSATTGNRRVNARSNANTNTNSSSINASSRAAGTAGNAAVWDAEGSVNGSIGGVKRGPSYRTAAVTAMTRARGRINKSFRGGSGDVSEKGDEGKGVPLCMEMRIRHVQGGAMSTLLEQTANVRLDKYFLVSYEYCYRGGFFDLIREGREILMCCLP